MVDEEEGHLALTHEGRRVLTRGALSELTSAVALTYCANKRMTRRVLQAAGLRVPRGRVATFDEADLAFLDEVGEVVVKPVDGEQGFGVTVGVADAEGLEPARRVAREQHRRCCEEQRCHGEELRVVVTTRWSRRHCAGPPRWSATVRTPSSG